MKRKFSSHSEVAHVWAQQSQSMGDASRMYFRDSTIYSYGSHFPAGIFITPDIVAINSDHYSISTTKHMGYVRDAVSHKQCLYLPTRIMKEIRPLNDMSGAGSKYRRKSLLEECIKHVQSEIVKAGEIASNTRRKPATRADAINSAIYEYDQVAQVLALYKMRLPVAVTRMLETLKTDASAIAAANKKALAAEAAKRAKAQRIEQARREAKAKEALPAWLAGNDDYEHRNALFSSKETYLRVKGENVETSRGATFPLAHGLRALPLIRAIVASGEVWQRNGKTIHLGHYQIDKIEAGQIVAGCHTIPVAEVERLAASLGV